MPQQLRVDTVGIQAMAGRWDASAGGLDETTAPTGVGLSCQPSAAAVNAAHADTIAFTAALATRVGDRAVDVTQADTRYITNETGSATALAAVAGV